MPKNPVILGLLEPRKRKTTAKSRLHGLIKKAAEWTILCNTELLLIAITDHDKVATAYSTSQDGSVLNHMQRLYDIYYKWENDEKSDYFCYKYNKTNVMQRYGGVRRVVYIDPRKKELIKKKQKNSESLGLVSMKDLSKFNTKFEAMVNCFKALDV